jgi:hypothetical protein
VARLGVLNGWPPFEPSVPAVDWWIAALQAGAVSSRLLVHPTLLGPAEVVVGSPGPGSCCPPSRRPSVPIRSGGSTPSCDAEATAARVRRPGGGR